MKKITLGVFSSREDAERAINHLHRECSVETDNISYVYRTVDNEVHEVDAGKVSSNTPGEGAKKGAVAGGTVGALAGLAAIVGAIPVVGPVFAAGPLLAALGIGGAIGTTAAGALTGAAAGGLIGALINLGVKEPDAQKYQDQVAAGNILLVVNADDETDVAAALQDHGATDVEVYTPAV